MLSGNALVNLQLNANAHRDVLPQPLRNRRSKLAAEFVWWHAVGHKGVLSFPFSPLARACRGCIVCAMRLRVNCRKELMIRGLSAMEGLTTKGEHQSWNTSASCFDFLVRVFRAFRGCQQKFLPRNPNVA